MKSSFAAIVLALVSSLALGQEDKSLTYKDWSVILSSDHKDLIALTSQDADKFLGYRCFTATGKCIHTIVTATSCDNGTVYPMLINSSTGSMMTNVTCSVHDGLNELLPADWAGFHSTILDSTGYIGFAIPLVSGQFKVVRFSLSGAKDAIAAAESSIKKDTAEYH